MRRVSVGGRVAGRFLARHPKVLVGKHGDDAGEGFVAPLVGGDEVGGGLGVDRGGFAIGDPDGREAFHGLGRQRGEHLHLAVQVWLLGDSGVDRSVEEHDLLVVTSDGYVGHQVQQVGLGPRVLRVRA